MAELESTWNVKHLAREPHTIICVSNLQTLLPTVTDAWGRCPVSQPALISCAVSLREPFTSASAEDAVTKSTVHYGTLSKTILEACNRFSSGDLKKPMKLSEVLLYIQLWMTGISIQTIPDLEIPANPCLCSAGADLVMLEVMLPKASLLGSGVRIKGAFRYDESNTVVTAYSLMLELCSLRIPTVIGVNLNEKSVKQVVVISVQIDRYDRNLDEAFHELEQITVKSVEESSFQTLEALGKHIGSVIIKRFIQPQIYVSQKSFTWPTIRLKLSKPTAVTLADAPTVEMLIDTNGKLEGEEI
ncbi:putative folic acid synthesis protein fol1 [Golovinomyces cichoracearum]|uniref:Putative folic acid synthesis protein fol1 n=1 Tax=Golovinomyces cichoracearum TaxID=62708 RepID=A0A420IRM1_9PEZI|nr:putative folic acid synthesis protein fol1 [Golovinomyces cichoracearum]